MTLIVACAHCGKPVQLPMQVGTDLVVRLSMFEFPDEVTSIVKAGSSMTVLHKDCVPLWHRDQEQEDQFDAMFKPRVSP